MLICTDGSPEAESAARFAAALAGPGGAETTVLAISEAPGGERAALAALRSGRDKLDGSAAKAELVVRAGDPVTEIVRRTRETAYDLVVIGASAKGGRGPYLLSAKAYMVVRAVEPPVLVVVGDRPAVRRILVCTGGREYIDPAVRLAGEFAAGAGAEVGLLHVMAEPPAIYAGLVRLEDETDQLLASDTVLGRNLRRDKELVEALGVRCRVLLRHGFVLDQILAEVHAGDYDLVVAGSQPTGRTVQRYIMGDVTKSILEQAERPVLVVRTTARVLKGGWLGVLRPVTVRIQRKA